MINNYTEKKDCRLCGTKLPEENILSLGDQCISAFVDGDQEPILAPLELVLCSECNLLQLRHTTNPDILYTDNYGYRTGLNSTMIKEMESIKEAVMGQKRLKEGDVVVDIGSSDGELLNGYPLNVIRVGFEPIKKFRQFY